MSNGYTATALISALLLVSGCGRKTTTVDSATTPTTTVTVTTQAPAPPANTSDLPVKPTINASMTKIMSIHAQTIWDITSRAFNSRGDGLVASKISKKDWAALADAAQQLRDRGLVLADARGIAVAGPGETIMGADSAGQPSKIGHDWDALSAKQVQARIDADPTYFAKRARILADAGETIVRASQAKDVEALYQVSSGMDEVCDGCHQRFWGTDDPPPFPKALERK